MGVTVKSKGGRGLYKDKERGKSKLREGVGGEEDCIKIKRGGRGS